MFAAANKPLIRKWWEEGVEQDATHMIIVCDTFSHDDYPVFVGVGEDVHKVKAKYDGTNMQKIMEVYSYNHDLEKQLKEGRAFHYD